MQESNAQILLESLNFNETQLLKDEVLLLNFFEKINQLDLDHLNILAKLTKENYLIRVIITCSKYKLGKIKNFKHDLIEINHFLFTQKKYSRIIQLKKILLIFEAKLEDYDLIMDKVNLRMKGENFKKYSDFIEFLDVVNNANLYIRSTEELSKFFKKADVFELEKFIETIFKSLHMLTSKDKIKLSIAELYHRTGNERLKEDIEEVYRDIKLSPVKRENTGKRQGYKESEAVGIDKPYYFLEQESQELIKQKIIELKYSLHDDDLNREQFIYIVNELIFCYQKLDDQVAAQKLKDYLNIKLGKVRE